MSELLKGMNQAVSMKNFLHASGRDVEQALADAQEGAEEQNPATVMANLLDAHKAATDLARRSTALATHLHGMANTEARLVLEQKNREDEERFAAEKEEKDLHVS